MFSHYFQLMIRRSAVVHSERLCMFLYAYLYWYSRVPQLCLLSRKHSYIECVYYDIAIAMCITAHVVKLLLLFALFICSIVRSFVCLWSIFSRFSFLVSFITLPVPMCVVHSSFFPFKLNVLPISTYQ